MKTNFLPASLRIIVVVLACVTCLGGCVTMPLESCEQFERNRKSTRYDTVYRYSDADTRLAAKRFTAAPKSESISARWYTLRINRAEIRPCDHLYLTKDLYLQRNGDAPVTLVERREFYTSDGKLIATKQEDVTAQLKTNGYYSAAVPLPIPKEAPAGGYRIVTKLIAKAKDGTERTLATANVGFRIP